MIAGRLLHRSSNERPEIRKIDQKEFQHLRIERALLYRWPRRRYRVNGLLAGCPHFFVTSAHDLL